MGCITQLYFFCFVLCFFCLFVLFFFLSFLKSMCWHQWPMTTMWPSVSHSCIMLLCPLKCVPPYAWFLLDGIFWCHGSHWMHAETDLLWCKHHQPLFLWHPPSAPALLHKCLLQWAGSFLNGRHQYNCVQYYHLCLLWSHFLQHLSHQLHGGQVQSPKHLQSSHNFCFSVLWINVISVSQTICWVYGWEKYLFCLLHQCGCYDDPLILQL